MTGNGSTGRTDEPGGADDEPTPADPSIEPGEGRSSVPDREATIAALSYLLGPLSAVGAWFLERDSPYVRFHAAQSLLFAASLVPLFLGLSFVQFLLVFVPGVGELLSIAFSFVYVLAALLVLGVWLRLMYEARGAVHYRLPLVGGVAERMS